MKKSFLILGCILLLSTVTDAQYKIDKTKYDFRTYKYEPGDPYQPPFAGLASFLIPGLGQITSGEAGRGAAFLGGFAGCIAVYFIGNSNYYTDEHGTHGGPGLLYLGFFGAITVDLISVIDAGRVAKVKNLAFRDKNRSGYNVLVSPYIGAFPNDKIPVGFSLRLRF